MAPVGTTQFETRWRPVLASFEKQYETLIANNRKAKEEVNLNRKGLIELGQLIQTSPQQNGKGATRKRPVEKTENEKNVVYKHLDGKALFTGLLRFYAAIHREMENSLLPDCAQGKEEAAPHSKRRKRNNDFVDGSSSSKREETEKCRPLPVYQKPRPVIKSNYFAPLRAVTMEGGEMYGEKPSSNNNLDKGRTPPIILIPDLNFLGLQKDLKAVVTGDIFLRNTASGTPITTRSMADYKAIQNLSNQKGFPLFTYYTKGAKPVKLL
jgi:hypothetical protein